MFDDWFAVEGDLLLATMSQLGGACQREKLFSGVVFLELSFLGGGGGGGPKSPDARTDMPPNSEGNSNIGSDGGVGKRK